jgi:diguanylate cyclase (GGDEF)-like protein
VSTLLPTAATALPLLTGWSAHTLWLRRRLHASRRDPLTGLLRREGFERAAAQVLRRHCAAVIVIDLDGFKQINDVHGHAGGDAVLAAVGARLWARGGLVVGRLGGDEFAVIAPADAPALRPLLGRLHAALCQPIDHEGLPLCVGASVGGVFAPAGTPLSVALRVADEAMYLAKQTGGGPRAAYDLAPAYATVNGRRDGRDGTHHDHAPDGGAS